jgi:hypothetical protein
VVQNEAHLTNDRFGKQWFNFTDLKIGKDSTGDLDLSTVLTAGQNPVSVAKLQLNGHDRFSEKDGRYFNLVQPYQHHENVPAKGINVYSFALRPEEHQPSGSCNMSRIDTASLNLTLTPATLLESDAVGADKVNARIKIFAVNYNVLRIMSGMGGLSYAS